MAYDEILYPVTIIRDRYNGCYSGGKWIAFYLEYDEIPSAVQGEDTDEMNFFWGRKHFIYGKGDTPDQAYEDLSKKVVRL